MALESVLPTPLASSGLGDQNDIKPGHDMLGTIGLLRADLPATGCHPIRFDAYHAGLGVQAACLLQGLCPCCHQTAHAGFGNPVCVFGQRAGGYHAACGVEHAHGVGAPGAAQVGHRVQGLGKSGVAHCEVLRSGVKAAVGRFKGAGAASGAVAFFKNGDLVPRLHQGAGACHAGHTGADDGDATGSGCGARCSGTGGGAGGLGTGHVQAFRAGVSQVGCVTHPLYTPGAGLRIKNGGGFPAAHAVLQGFAAGSATIAAPGRAR